MPVLDRFNTDKEEMTDGFRKQKADPAIIAR